MNGSVSHHENARDSDQGSLRGAGSRYRGRHHGVGYNELVERLPQYERPPVVGVFGIAPAMIGVGLHWGRQALAEMRRRDV